MKVKRWATFRESYIATGGSDRSASSYLTYLRAVERASGDIIQRCTTLGYDAFKDWIERQPDEALGGRNYARHARSALRRYAEFHFHSPAIVNVARQNVIVHPEVREKDDEETLSLLREAKLLGARYYRATGKPLGVTGEVAELEAAEKLGLRLCKARTPAFDAIDEVTGRSVQIKGRAVDRSDRYRGMCPGIRCDPTMDVVALVLLDKETLHAIEIWTAGREVVKARLDGLISENKRERGVLSISQFRSIGVKAWAGG